MQLISAFDLQKASSETKNKKRRRQRNEISKTKIFFKLKALKHRINY